MGVEVICIICGNPFFTQISKVRKGKGKYCSRKCFGVQHSKDLMGKETKPIIERFMSKVEKTQDGCWNWTGAVAPGGYGKFNVEKKKIRKCFNAHRWSYEHFKGSIPNGLTLDHLCRNRRCVNPDHLEPVTIGENLLRGNGVSGVNARKTHCPKGHPLILGHFPCHQGKSVRYCPICNKWENRKRI
jgi:hypothetical protein